MANPERSDFNRTGSPSLRVRPKTSWGITELSEHEADRGEAEEGERIVVAVFPVLGETAAAIEPADSTLDEPALWLDGEAFGAVATFDDVDLKIWQNVGDAVAEHRTGVGGVGEQPSREGKLSEQGGQQQHTAIAVLNVGSGDQCVQQQTEFVDQNVSLLAFDQLACIEAVRVDGRPPFSALLTLWLSTIQALGLASRPAWSRHFT